MVRQDPKHQGHHMCQALLLTPRPCSSSSKTCCPSHCSPFYSCCSSFPTLQCRGRQVLLLASWPPFLQPGHHCQVGLSPLGSRLGRVCFGSPPASRPLHSTWR